MYSECLWYPGRQINYMNLIKQLQTKNAANGAAHHHIQQVLATRETFSNDRGSLLTGSTDYLEDIVEPPKYITAKHVSAIFDKLGYDSQNGITVFNILNATAYRLKKIELQSQMTTNHIQQQQQQQQQQSKKEGDVAYDSEKITAEDIKIALNQPVLKSSFLPPSTTIPSMSGKKGAASLMTSSLPVVTEEEEKEGEKGEKGENGEKDVNHSMKDLEEVFKFHDLQQNGERSQPNTPSRISKQSGEPEEREVASSGAAGDDDSEGEYEEEERAKLQENLTLPTVMDVNDFVR
jgi:NACalpha-BTF3-like transcription factor